jgi:hypothetical protein
VSEKRWIGHDPCPCGKVPYETREAAEARLETLRGRHKVNDPKTIRPYRCHFCSMFHLGHRPGSTRRGTRRYI